MHYQRWKRHGAPGQAHPQRGPTDEPVLEKLFRFTLIGDDCWNWTGRLRPDGYGSVNINSRMWLAHRAWYTAMVGEIPEDLVLDHLCHNRACVNPEHLEPVTRAVNNRRKSRHCPGCTCKLSPAH